MRAWAKRMIWFFGIQLLWLLNYAIDVYAGKPIASSADSLVWVALCTIPLILIEDD